MNSLAAGDRVWHLAYGAGIVVTMVAGHRARVRFDGFPGLPRTLLQAELQLAGAPPIQDRAAPSKPAPPRAAGPAPEPSVAGPGGPSSNGRTQPTPPLATEPPATLPPPGLAYRTLPSTAACERADVRQTLEALRLGVVPARFVEDYTVGRDAELRQLGSLLDAAQGLRAVWGDYGTGKTHILDVVEHKARERGLATSRVVLDPLEVPPTHPKRLYTEIVRNLRLPNSADRGFGTLAHELCESGAHRHRRGGSFSRFFSPYLHALHANDEEAIALLRDYVEGEEIDTQEAGLHLFRLGWSSPRLLALSDYRTYGRMYMHMIGTLATWVRDAGHRGLLVLFDEVEYVDALAPDLRDYAIQVLMHFAAATLAPESLRFDPESLYRGGQPVHRSLPLRYRPDQPLAAVFALTPLDNARAIYELMVKGGCHSIDLQPLRHAHVDELMMRLYDLYRRAHPGFEWTPEQRLHARRRIVDSLGDDAWAMRRLVQRTVFVLDEHRFGGAAHGA
ncbi:MAG: hypothetical protein FJ265_08260 [Planctomycetes bacterium]|nr:hypothetical protein [Planctomycetota bacterium]